MKVCAFLCMSSYHTKISLINREPTWAFPIQIKAMVQDKNKDILGAFLFFRSDPMALRAPLTKIASLCLSIAVSLLPLQNPFAFQ